MVLGLCPDEMDEMDEAYDENDDHWSYAEDEVPDSYVLLTEEQLRNDGFMKPILQKVLSGKAKFYVKTGRRNYEKVVVEQGWPTGWTMYSMERDSQLERGITLEDAIDQNYSFYFESTEASAPASGTSTSMRSTTKFIAKV